MKDLESDLKDLCVWVEITDAQGVSFPNTGVLSRTFLIAKNMPLLKQMNGGQVRYHKFQRSWLFFVAFSLIDNLII